MRIQLQALRHFALPGGTTRYCLRLGDALSRQGHNVECLCPALQMQGDTYVSVGQVGLREHAPIPSTPILWRLPALGRVRKYGRVAKAYSCGVDLLVSRNCRYALAARRVLRRSTRVFYVAPEIESFRLGLRREASSHSGGIRRYVDKALSRWTERCALQEVDLVVFSNQMFLDWTAEYFGWRGQNWTVNEFGVDDLLKTVARDRRTVRNSLGIPLDAVVLISVGRFDPIKNYRQLLHAASLVPRTDLHLLLVGDGEERARLVELSEKLGLAGRVHFPGFVSEPADLYAAADIFAMTSSHESFGQAYLEAMVCRLPVVAPTHDMPRTFSPFSSIIRDAHAGVLFDREDSSALAKRLADLAENAQQRTQMGVAGREYALRRFSWEKHAARLIEYAETSNKAQIR